MVKKIALGFILMGTIAFGKINDYRKVFNEQDINKLNSSISQFEKKTGNKMFLNTLEENEGFQTEEQEKAVIVNIIQDANGNVKVQVQLSQDLNPEDISPEITLLLDNVETTVNKKDETLLSEKLIDGLYQIFTTEDNDDTQVETQDDSMKLKIFLGIVLTISVICIRIIQVKRKKRKYKFKK
ncbi:hypothetical protein [uncultured Cetobacterium sp.]|uniref:hypothetical protein n=1 Tax=uncultured Cetobacterium sp. TaxID=527638 RepID=UPI002614ECA7|nr:hypothetical protein [uncultured Cetobacterium sp.]